MATNHEVGSSILSGRTSFPVQPGIPVIPRLARDFACGLPLRSRPQNGSSSILSGRTSFPVQPGIPEIPRLARDFACGLPLRSRPQNGSSSILSGRTTLPTCSELRTDFVREIAKESL